MNLIEQLGGYENAVERLKRENVLSDEDFNYGQAQLLKYRREHNIFEVGDHVVYAENEFYVVVDIQGSRNIAIKDINSDFTMSVAFKHCRHATPEEIQAGRRLP